MGITQPIGVFLPVFFFFFFKECEEYITFSPPAPFMCFLLSFLSSVINGITNVTGTPE